MEDGTRDGSEIQDEYDAVVIGSGVGGLAAAAMLSRGGRKTLVVERSNGLGGNAQAIRRGPYVFDAAMHITGQGAPDELFQGLLEYLDVPDLCRLIRTDPPYGGQLPGLRFNTALEWDPFIEAHASLFPDEREGIRTFFETCRTMHWETHQQPPQLAFKDLDQVAQMFPILFRYGKATLAEVLEEFIGDERARAVCGAAWPYFALPPSKLSFMTYCSLLAAAVVSGQYHCEGSFENIALALATAHERHGGDTAVGTEVERILVEDGKATGVVLSDGRTIQTRAVVSNGDATRTFETLVGPEHLPDLFLKRLRRMRPSLSAVVLYAAADIDIHEQDLPHELFIYHHWDHDETYTDILEGRPGGLWLSVPTVVDSSLAPEGEHVFILTCLASYDAVAWDTEKERFSELLIDEVDAVAPGFRDNLRYAEVATPRTIERYTLNRGGAIYGWEYLPSQSGSKRLSHPTPIEGLYLAGHWTQPGAGCLRVLVSGIHAAELVLTNPQLGEPIAPFRHPDLPPV